MSSSSSSTLHKLMPLIGLLLFSIASVVIWHSIRHYSLDHQGAG